VSVDLSGPAFRCTCPSRKFPCKHGLALSDEGAPAYDPENASVMAGLGVPAFACTPDLFPDLMAAAIQRQDISAWASANGITTAAPTPPAS
jgi:uncharacterized Zn finger protein